MGGIYPGGGYCGQYSAGGEPPAPPSGPYAALDLTGTYVQALPVTGTVVTTQALTGTVDG